MKKIALFFFTFCILTNAAAVRAGITFAVDAANDELPEYRIQGMSMEQRREYCTGFGFKLMSCTDPYMPEALDAAPIPAMPASASAGRNIIWNVRKPTDCAAWGPNATANMRSAAS